MITCITLSPAWDVTYSVDEYELGRIHRPLVKIERAGGKALNVARVLETLGENTHVIAPLGGMTGARMREHMVDAFSHVVIVPTESETRTCVSVLDRTTAVTTEVYEHAPTLLPDELAAIAAAIDSTETHWLAVSGSLPAAALAPVSAALRRARDRGASVALDVQGDALREWIGDVRPALVKVNRAEAADVLGAGSPAALARGLRDAGADIAVVTDGPRGASAASATEQWHVSSPSGGAHTVGAGDSFFAGLLAVLSRGRPLADGLRHAAALASATTREPGAGAVDPAVAAGILADVTLENDPPR